MWGFSKYLVKTHQAPFLDFGPSFLCFRDRKLGRKPKHRLDEFCYHLKSQGHRFRGHAEIEYMFFIFFQVFSKMKALMYFCFIAACLLTLTWCQGQVAESEGQPDADLPHAVPYSWIRKSGIPAASPDLIDLVYRNSLFGFDLFKHITRSRSSSGQKVNVLMSPFSISSALSLINLGASGWWNFSHFRFRPGCRG